MGDRNHTVRPPLRVLEPDQRSPALTRRPYDQQMRKKAVLVSMMGQEQSPLFGALRAAKRHLSIRTIQRYKKRLREEGNLAPYQHNGNRRARVLRGADLVLLAYYRTVFPKALLSEIAAFLWNAWGRFQNPPVLYSLPDISKADFRLGLTRKKGSTTAYQAYLPRNILRRRAFWLEPWPYGIADVPAHDMVDIDEAGIFLETANRSYGKAVVNARVRQAGNYGHSEKWTLIMAVAGRPGQHDRYAEFMKRPGTDIVVFANFVQ